MNEFECSRRMAHCNMADFQNAGESSVSCRINELESVSKSRVATARGTTGSHDNNTLPNLSLR